MSPTTPHHPIRVLNPISDDDPLDAVSRDAWDDLAAAIVATPAPAPHVPRTHARVRTRRPVLRLVVGAGAMAGAIVGMTGALSGQGPTGIQNADAAILRRAAAALHPTGAIVIDSSRSVDHYPRGFTPSPDAGPRVRHVSSITETPAGSGAQNELVLSETGTIAGIQFGYVNGNNELYDPTDNLAYVSSNYSPDITRGPRPGTYTYTMPEALFFRLPSGLDPGAKVPPLMITAAQARALRNGSAEVGADRAFARQRRLTTMRIQPAFRVPSDSSTVHAWLGSLKVVGPTTVDGRRAIKLVPVRGRGEYDVAPGTGYPVREVVDNTDGTSTVTTWSVYRVLPATPANERLLSVTARHPGARIDHNRADFIAAYNRMFTGD
jgi:hypothetical protein